MSGECWVHLRPVIVDGVTYVVFLEAGTTRMGLFFHAYFIRHLTAEECKVFENLEWPQIGELTWKSLKGG